MSSDDRVEESGWTALTRENPDHSTWYVERFRSMAAAGDDLDGEARLVDAMVGRGAHILDAGCGPGRVGAALHTAGHRVVGVDVDPVLIEAAEQDHPGPTWLVGDLTVLDLPGRGIEEPFDLIVSAGNVIAFLAPSTRVRVLERLRAHLAAGGSHRGRLRVGPGLRVRRVLRGCGDRGAARRPGARELGRASLHRRTQGFLVAVLAVD